MSRSPRYLLSDAEKDGRLAQQAALIEQQALAIEALQRQVAALQAQLKRPKKTSRNGHVPPSQDPKGGAGGPGAGKPKPRKKRPSRPGVSRRLAATPNATVVCHSTHCQGCGADVRAMRQRRRRRYDHVATPAPHPAGRELQALVKAWRGKFFVFLEDRRVPATNNESEVRHSVVFRKVTGGFRSTWGAEVHAGYRSLTSTAARQGHTAFDAIRDLVTANPPISARPA